jgi:phosphatidylserine/phosphatidylglycerophosphate/cardiolipin synthase-like enzyme
VVKQQLIAKKSLAFSPNRPDAPYNFMHNKTVVVDGDTVITGSFNFSQNATRNAENILILHDPELAGKYADYIDHLPSSW